MAMFIVLLGSVGCTNNVPPVWIHETGEGIEHPWLEAGEARRKAREAAIQDARMQIWRHLLQMQIMQPDGSEKPPMVESNRRISSDADPKRRSFRAESTIKKDDPATITLRVDTLQEIDPEVAADADARKVWGSDRLPKPEETEEAGSDILETIAIEEEERAGYNRLTVEQLAAINPVFRAKVWSMIENLEPRKVQVEEEGLVRVRLRADTARVLQLARKHLDPQR